MLLTNNRYRDWIVAGIIGAVVTGALVMTGLTASSSATEDAALLRATDLAIAAEDLAMVTVGQAIGVAESVTLGVADAGDLSAATEAAESAIAAVGQRIESIPGTAALATASQLDDWQIAAGRVVTAVRIGDTGGAAAQFSGELVPAAGELSASLIGLRDEYAAAVADADSWLAYATRLTGVVFIFLLPVAAIVVYRVSAQRQLAEMSALLDTRVAAEAVAGSGQAEHWVDAIRQLSVPVAVVASNAQQLLGRSEQRDPEETAKIAELRYSAERLAAHLADLNVAVGGDRGIAVNPVSIPAARMLDAVIADFAASGNEIGGSYGQGSVSADPDLLEQILRNLISNAIAHGGPDVRIYGDRAGSRYVISVEDNGSGLPPQLAETFEGDADFEAGSGLGLTVSRKLAEAMGGSLEYERFAGRTTLLLSLPAVDTDQIPRDAAMVAADG